MEPLDKLGAVNLILRKLGEIPVTNIDEPYPTLAVALPALDEAQATVLSEGYWFNTFYGATLQPLVDGRVMVPLDCLKFFPDDAKFAFTGTQIRDSETGSEFLHVPVKGRLILNMDFEQLPPTARYAIAYTAAADVYRNDIGPDETYADISRYRDAYIAQVNGDHTVSRKQNSRTRRQFERYRRSLNT
ncbi:hypothetical protein D3C77_34750 [compost metagenome]